jgi:hypothetical protein
VCCPLCPQLLCYLCLFCSNHTEAVCQTPRNISTPGPLHYPLGDGLDSSSYTDCDSLRRPAHVTPKPPHYLSGCARMGFWRLMAQPGEARPRASCLQERPAASAPRGADSLITIHGSDKLFWKPDHFGMCAASGQGEARWLPA